MHTRLASLIRSLSRRAVICLITALAFVPAACLAQTPRLSVQAIRSAEHANQQQRIPVLVSVQVDNDVRQFQALNIAFALNLSEAFEGEELEHIKQAVLSAITLLRARDTVSILNYGATVRVELPATSVAESNLILKQARDIRTFEGNNHIAGLSKAAYEVGKKFDLEKINKIILITSSSCDRESHSKQRITELVQALRKDRILISTIGIGDAYDEICLGEIAHAGGGQHYFAETSKQLSAILEREIAETQRLVADSIELSFKAAPQVRIANIYYPFLDNRDQADTIRLTPLAGQQEQQVFLELDLPMVRGDTSEVVLTTTLRYKKSDESEWTNSVDQLSIRFTDEAYEPDLSIHTHVADSFARLEANQHLTAALLLSLEGGRSEAIAAINTATAQLRAEYKRTKRPVLLREALRFEAYAKEFQSTKLEVLKRRFYQRQYRYRYHRLKEES